MKIRCLPETGKVHAFICPEEFFEIINQQGNIDSIVANVSEGIIMQNRAFTMANRIRNEAKNLRPRIYVIKLINLFKANQRW